MKKSLILKSLLIIIVGIMTAIPLSRSLAQSYSAKVQVTMVQVYPSLDLTTGTETGGGQIHISITNTGAAFAHWRVDLTWPAQPSSVYGSNGSVVNLGGGQMQLIQAGWDTTGLTAGGVLGFDANPSWSDVQGFIPYNIILTNTDTNTQVPLTIDTSGAGLYLRPPSTAAMGTKKVVAWYPNWDLTAAKASLQAHISILDEVHPEWYALSASGTIEAAEASGTTTTGTDFWYDQSVFDTIHGAGKKITPTINNYSASLNDFDASRVSSMLNNSAVQSQHITDIVNLVTSHNYDGIDVDYENMNTSDKAALGVFIQNLATALHAKNKVLSFAAYAKVGDGTWNGPQAQDLKAIGNAVDELAIMTYDLHWSTSAAGIISSPDWANDSMYYARSQMADPSKILQGMPFYGYDWGGQAYGQPAPGVTYVQAAALISQYSASVSHNSVAGDATFTYSVNGTGHTVYFQDDQGIAKKLTAMDKYNLGAEIGGIAIWRLGGDSDAMWAAISSKLKNGVPIPTSTKTNTPAATNTNTSVPTKTNTPTFVPATNTPTKTNTATTGPSLTPSKTNTNTPVPSSTTIPTKTSTPTTGPSSTPTRTSSPTTAPTNTNTPAPTATSSGVAAWDPNSHAYKVGDLVTYNGHTYKCIQAHTSQPGWDPVSVPALWQLVS